MQIPGYSARWISEHVSGDVLWSKLHAERDVRPYLRGGEEAPKSHQQHGGWSGESGLRQEELETDQDRRHHQRRLHCMLDSTG